MCLSSTYPSLPHVHPTSMCVAAHDEFHQASLLQAKNAGVRRPGYPDIDAIPEHIFKQLQCLGIYLEEIITETITYVLESIGKCHMHNNYIRLTYITWHCTLYAIHMLFYVHEVTSRSRWCGIFQSALYNGTRITNNGRVC